MEARLRITLGRTKTSALRRGGVNDDRTLARECRVERGLDRRNVVPVDPADVLEPVRATQAGEMGAALVEQARGSRRIGTAVVVDDDDHGQPRVAEVVETLERESAGERTVPDNRHDAPLEVPEWWKATAVP